MRKSQHYARTSALPAIAAALALSSTPVFAQEAPSTSTPPVASDPAPTVSADPAPAVDSSPVATDPVEATTTKTVTKRTTTTAKAAPKVATRTVTQKVTRTAHAAVPAAAVAPVATTPPVATPAPAKPAPVVDLSAKPANPAPAPVAKAEPANSSNETAMELGGGALALIAIGAGAYALTRRRRREDEVVDEVYEPETATTVEPEPEIAPRHDAIVREEPPMIAPEMSAFAWGNQAPAARTTADEDDGSDRNPGESWVERAYRGPSPANPSVSLKARLKRAAFFDKRERDVAAGKAEPVDTDAGLPDAMVEEQERELA